MPRVSIGEAAQRVGVSAHTLRYYERVGAVPSVDRDDAGRRQYSQSDLDWARYASCLRAMDVSVADIAAYVAAAERVGGRTKQVALLRRHLERMRRQREELDHFIDVATAKLAILTGAPAGGATARSAAQLSTCPHSGSAR